jgi:hypothetical protein
MGTTVTVLVLLATAAVAATPPAPPARPDPPPVSPGRYLLRASARIDTNRLSRQQALDVLALVNPGARPGDVELRLRAGGHDCDLRARRDRAGELVLAAGQTCRVALDGADARGTFEARLTSGGGRLRDGELALRLTFDVAGALRTRLAIPGAEELGETWTPELPLRGVVEGSGRGPEERARRAPVRATPPGESAGRGRRRSRSSSRAPPDSRRPTRARACAGSSCRRARR